MTTVSEIGVDDGFDGVAFDTYAWIELLGGGPQAAAVQGVLMSHDVATSVLVLAELADAYGRQRPDQWEAARDAVTSTSCVVRLDPQLALRAGATKRELRGTRGGIGLVECIIYETARALGVDLVTGDPHLKGLDGVRFLG